MKMLRAVMTGLALAASLTLAVGAADAATKHKKHHHRHRAKAEQAELPVKSASKKPLTAEEKLQKGDTSMEKSLKNICTNC